MSKRRMLRNSVVVVLLFSLSGCGAAKTSPVRVKKTDPPKNSKAAKAEKPPAPPKKAPTDPPKKEPTGPPPTPQQVVEEAIKIHFRDEVRITKVSLDKGVLTLEGVIAKNRQIQDAREVAVSALEEAGFGPIPQDKVINLLRKPGRE